MCRSWIQGLCRRHRTMSMRSRYNIHRKSCCSDRIVLLLNSAAFLQSNSEALLLPGLFHSLLQQVSYTLFISFQNRYTTGTKLECLGCLTFVRRSVGFTPPWRSNSTNAEEPKYAAWWGGCQPSLQYTSILAPLPMRYFAISSWPYSQARCKARLPEYGHLASA